MTAATSIDFRSPIRVARIPEGIFVTIEPMPSSEPTRAAIEVLAPRSNALSAMTGIIEPSARPNRVGGAYAATAIERRRNSLTSASHGPRHPGTGHHEGRKE